MGAKRYFDELSISSIKTKINPQCLDFKYSGRKNVQGLNVKHTNTKDCYSLFIICYCSVSYSRHLVPGQDFLVLV